MMTTKPQTPKKYRIFYTATRNLKTVTREIFLKISGRVFVFDDVLVKVVGYISRKEMKNLSQEFIAQGLYVNTKFRSVTFGEIVKSKNVIKLGDYVIGYNGVKFIGQGYLDFFLKWFESISSGISSVKLITNKINKSFLVLISKLYLEILDFNHLVHGGRVTQIINILLSIFSLNLHFQAQGLESMLLAGVVPDCVINLLKKASLFTNVKIFDDLVFVHEFVDLLQQSIVYLLDLFKIPEEIKTRILSVFDLLKIGKKHVLLREMKTCINQGKDKKYLMCVVFRKQCLDLELRVINDASFMTWVRQFPYVFTVYEEWKRFLKIVKSYDEPDRVEPNTFILEGPPGIFKSVIMTKVIEALGWSSYSHVVPSVDNSKDFYDSYNNEEIFYMDDVGQEGVSQWRTLMNMHSCVKMPLPCADAKLKDTKFFNSSTILLTTNCFQHLQGICKNDCIADVRALWRRGFIFDFANVSKNEDNGLRGTVLFKYFDVRDELFKVGFPPDYKESFLNLRSDCILDGATLSENFLKLTVWMASIISIFRICKEKNRVSNKWTDSQLQIIRAQIENNKSYFDTHEAQGGVFGLFGFDDLFHSYLDSFKDFIFSSYNKYDVNYLLLSFILISLIYVVYKFLTWKRKDKLENAVADFVAQQGAFDIDASTLHNSIGFVQKNMYEIDLVLDGQTLKGLCLASGRHLIFPSHFAAADEMRVVIYKSRLQNHVIVDNELIKKKYVCIERDVAVYSLPECFPSPFKNLCDKFDKVDMSKELYLLHPMGVRKIVNYNTLKYQAPYTFKFGEYNFKGVLHPDYITHDLQFMGLCGSVVVDGKGNIIGMHVAGSPSEDIGVASFFSNEIKEVLREVLLSDKSLLPYEVSSKICADSSVMKLDAKMYANVPKESDYVPSPLYGIYPIDREPANLQKFGKFTVKEVAKKSFSCLKSVNEDEMQFGEMVLDALIEPFDDISEKEVVLGNEYLAGLNKDSSNGYLCKKEKSEYIDFENGCVTPFFRKELDEFLMSVENKNVDYSKLFWVETLKDELRNQEKDGVPRSFRVGTIHMQYLKKLIFGNMVSNIMKSRSFNKIMIGCNPIKEWPEIYDHLLSGSCFAGDIAKFDGNMLCQIQRSIVNILCKKYRGKYKEVCKILLESVVHSLLIIMDDLYVTTHSMPSGSFLTAIFNSFVNRFLTAMWYKRNVPAKFCSLDGFYRDVDDYVYGDDKLNVIRNHKSSLNAISMRDFFQSLGMDFTDSIKRPIQTYFQPISELTFLKRYFRYHADLQAIVCPLELRVIRNSLSYVNKTKDVQTVLKDKLHAAQREFYLHPDYKELLEDLYFRIKKYSINFSPLSQEYLRSVYKDPNCNVPFSFSDFSLYA